MYFTCSDCGESTSRESYKLKSSVWDLAVAKDEEPPSDGLSGYLCIHCLRIRLFNAGHHLSPDDFPRTVWNVPRPYNSYELNSLLKARC